MMDVSGKELTLDQVKKKNGLLVIFSCNTCPWVLAWESRYAGIADACTENEIGFILVNSNENQRDDADSYEAMQEHARQKGYAFPYAIDKNNELADAFGADRTPEVYLFDSSMKLVYTGAIDDNARHEDQVKEHFLLDAIMSMVNGTKIANPMTKSLGCSIKRST